MAKQTELSDHEVKHLELIQGVVNRMAANSFQMKGWMVVVVSALLAIYAENNNWLYPIFALLPTFIFWGLDAYYLQQERKFRGLYGDAAKLTKEPKKKDVPLFAMRPDLYTGGTYSFWNVFFSVTLVWLYLPVALILGAIAFILTPR